MMKIDIDSINKGNKSTGKTKTFSLILLTLVSAILFALAQPNELFKHGLPILVFFCLTPLFVALLKSPSYGFASILGIIFGTLTTYITYYWLQFFGNYTVFTIGGVMFVYFCYFALLAPFLRGLSQIDRSLRPFILAVAWTVYEYLKSSGFLAFPWTLISQPMHGVLPLIQFVDITGIWGLSFLIALVNTVIAEIVMDPPAITIKGFSIKKILEKQWAKHGIFTISVFGIVLIYGIIRLVIPIPAENNVKVIMVQQNRDPWARGRNNYELSILNAEALTLAGVRQAGDEKPDMVIWSETSFQSDLSNPRSFLRLELFPEKKPFVPFVKKLGCYFLVGAPYRQDEDGSELMNSVVLITPELEINQFYGKQHPVPFVESIPFYEIPVIRQFYSRVIGIHGVWDTGNVSAVFSLPLKNKDMLKFSTPICFEDAFPDLCRKFILGGAEMFINLTNVSWSKTDSAELQMLNASAFRAIENRRVLLRSTNSGVTCIIDAKGRVLKKLPLFKSDFILADVPVMKENSYTPYTLFGDYIPVFFGFILLVSCIAYAICIRFYKKTLNNA